MENSYLLSAQGKGPIKLTKDHTSLLVRNVSARLVVHIGRTAATAAAAVGITFAAGVRVGRR